MDESEAGSEQGIRITVWVIWGALLCALGTYVFILRTAVPAPSETRALDPTFPRILAFVASGIAVVSLVLRQLLLGGFKSGALQLDTIPGKQRFMTGNVVCFAMSESLGIFGLILGFMGYPLDLSAKFFFGAVALMLWHMPLRSRFVPDT